ncbi:hypothetical protein DM02DRAFT_610941 [Periconia macrospinosa]|uniref:Uncharacterized protein n=1 Tax=Periconia macrospinosa TaxID=97972 RepID=A0A2V1E4J4_9PLEO|nr:hypothetical protein DM02DRAFT_610941 [Periconia macrospinosa]
MTFKAVLRACLSFDSFTVRLGYATHRFLPFTRHPSPKLLYIAAGQPPPFAAASQTGFHRPHPANKASAAPHSLAIDTINPL